MYQVISSTSPVCKTQYPLITLLTYQSAYELLLDHDPEIGQLPVNETSFFDLQCFLYKMYDADEILILDNSTYVQHLVTTIDQQAPYIGLPMFYSVGGVVPPNLHGASQLAWCPPTCMVPTTCMVLLLLCALCSAHSACAAHSAHSALLTLRALHTLRTPLCSLCVRCTL